MKTRVSAIIVILLFAGCSRPARQISIAERYDRLKRQLQRVTQTSGVVSTDTMLLRNAVSRGVVRRERRAAIRLKRDARRFSRLAGHAGNSVRTLAGLSASKPLGRYLSLIALALGSQWMEGIALQRLADLIWFDPLLRVGSAAARLHATVSWAQSSADRATRQIREADAIRLTASNDFRYTLAHN